MLLELAKQDVMLSYGMWRVHADWMVLSLQCNVYDRHTELQHMTLAYKLNGRVIVTASCVSIDSLSSNH